VFYGWLEAEGEIPVSPMARMRPPTVPDQPVPVVREDAFRRLLETCAGRDCEARRDTALILLLADVGPRRAEVAGMRLTDLDFDLQVAVVVGKDGRQRALPFGRRTAQALDRYLRVRARHPRTAQVLRDIRDLRGETHRSLGGCLAGASRWCPGSRPPPSVPTRPPTGATARWRQPRLVVTNLRTAPRKERLSVIT
jgi:integrase